MRNVFFFVLCTGMLAFPAQSSANPSSPRGECVPVGSDHRWIEVSEGNWKYYFRGQLTGWYDERSDSYWHFVNGQWSDPVSPPWSSSAKKRTIDLRKDPGVERALIPSREELRIHDGKRVTIISDDFGYSSSENELPNDAGLPRLTVIGSQAELDRVKADLAAYPELMKNLSAQFYLPHNFALRCGFVTTGNPSIYLQAPGGKVLHHQDHYNGGVQALVGAIRKPRPDYNPANDPDLTKPMVPGMSEIPWPLFLLGGGAAWIMFGERLKELLSRSWSATTRARGATRAKKRKKG